MSEEARQAMIGALLYAQDRPGWMYADASAKSILEGLEAKGFVVVRKEPTDEMVEAGILALEALPNDARSEMEDYRAMIAAALQASQHDPEQTK